MQSKTINPLKALSWVFLAFSGLGLVIRFVNIGNPLNSWDGFDEMNYALIARSLMSGELPYHGVFDHKPIGLYYIFALFFKNIWLYTHRNTLDAFCGNRADKLATVSDSKKANATTAAFCCAMRDFFHGDLHQLW